MILKEGVGRSKEEGKGMWRDEESGMETELKGRGREKKMKWIEKGSGTNREAEGSEKRKK